MTDTSVTAELAAWIVGLKGQEIPGEVRAEGVRSLVNWVGCAAGGASHEAADRALAAVTPSPARPRRPCSAAPRSSTRCMPRS
jgi:hypothetical protein